MERKSKAHTKCARRPGNLNHSQYLSDSTAVPRWLIQTVYTDRLHFPNVPEQSEVGIEDGWMDYQTTASAVKVQLEL